MNYRYGQSVLGFGCMRFPRKGNGFDYEEIKREIAYAYENGVNYYDTAFIYPGSEEVLGRVVEELGIRENITIATKLPHYYMKNAEEAEKHFTEQLKRLRTNYLDNFLMHMLPDIETLQALIDRGILAWAEKKVSEGAIKRIGFSYHGSYAMFEQIFNAYDWKFCQIQYNYMDEHSQAGTDGLMLAAGKGVPVIIMEPLRGGKLADMVPKAAVELFRKVRPNWSNAEWSFRWLYNHPEVTTVLSGMNSMEMLRENIQVASDLDGNFMNEEDYKTVEAVQELIRKSTKVPCTGCAYCMPCPAGVDIPGCFRSYNAIALEGYVNAMREYFMCTTTKKQKSNASLCKECGLCETHCPQHISIRSELKRVKRGFENPIYYIGKFVTKLMGMS